MTGHWQFAFLVAALTGFVGLPSLLILQASGDNGGGPIAFMAILVVLVGAGCIGALAATALVGVAYLAVWTRWRLWLWRTQRALQRPDDVF